MSQKSRPAFVPIFGRTGRSAPTLKASSVARAVIALAILSGPAIAADVTAADPDKVFDKERFAKEVTRSKDLPNFHQVYPYLYRSGEPTQTGFQKLPSYGIKTVIDLRAANEKTRQETEWAKKLGIKYVNLPMSSEPPTKQQVQTMFDEVSAAKGDTKKNGAVLVHCAHGSDRTGCMIGIWRVTVDGWTYPEAYKEMRHYWFTPKFTKLSGTVQQFANAKRK